MRRLRHPAALALLGIAALLVLLAFARPLDHDESQYVAAAMLARHGLPYRDFAYLQTPLQPLLLAPLAALFGPLAFPGLRIVNALLGAAATGFVFGAARGAGVDRRRALIVAGLFASCDIVLFSADIARNDMLPAALFAAAIWAMLRQTSAPSSARAALIGLLLSAATAAKVSYAIPALAFGGLALLDRRYRPGWLMLGALPPALLVGWTWLAAPGAFAFEVLRFPSVAPDQFYTAGRAFKLTLWGRALDTLKFLALGPALPALVVVARARRRERVPVLLDLMIVAGLIAALLPAPTWRQYLLPVLPPLFVRLALIWQARPPGRPTRVAVAIFAGAGVTPSLAMLAMGLAGGLPLARAIDDGHALRRAMDGAGVVGPVATLSPQFLPATGRPVDPRFAAGPFYFRSHGLLAADDEARYHLIGEVRASTALAGAPPAAIMVGGEGDWTSGDARLDRAMATIATRLGWQSQPVPGTPFRLFVRPR